MNGYVRQLLGLGLLVLTALFFGLAHADEAAKFAPQESSSHHSHSSHSSHCREFFLPVAKKIKAPPYISSENGKPVMQVAVINRTSHISLQLLERILKIVTKQAKEDFSPFYGIYVKFTYFADETMVDWTRYVPLIFDDLLPFDCSCISFHALNTNDLNGFPIGDAVFNPPPIPVGTPYMVVPMGNPTTDYGVIAISLMGFPYLPPSFDGLLCQTTSHEVLETLHNYTSNLYTFDFAGTTTLNNINAFINEVCDPFQFTPGYRLCGLNVANFALPSFWVNDLDTGPYDFLNTSPAPFTPYAGEVDLLRFGPCGGEFLTIFSLPPSLGDPSVLILVDNGSVFNPCICDSATSSQLKAPSPKGCCDAGSRIHAFRVARKPIQAPGEKAA